METEGMGEKRIGFLQYENCSNLKKNLGNTHKVHTDGACCTYTFMTVYVRMSNEKKKVHECERMHFL